MTPPRRSTRVLAALGVGAFAVYTARVLLNLFGPALPYSMHECPGGSNDSPEFLEFLSIVTNAAVRYSQARQLVNGAAFYPAQLDAIRRARRAVSMEYYEWQPGEISHEILAALTERARAGVQVRIVVDAVGSFRTPRSLFDELLSAGGRMHWYHPLRWDTWQFANNRSHRKLTVIDGEIAFAGGAGIADHWLKDTEASGPRWRDTVFSMTGDAVPCLLSTFSENWLESSGEILSSPALFRPNTNRHGAPTLIVSSTPAGGGTTARILFQALIRSAKEDLCITTPYFLPDRSARHALADAARDSRVRVRILTAGSHIDHPSVRRLSHHNSRHLLRAGAEIYEYDPAMIHAKLMVVDHAWCVFGSTNFDHRSFALNDEINVAIFDRELARDIETQFEKDLEQSNRLTIEDITAGGLLGELELAGGSLLERES